MINMEKKNTNEMTDHELLAELVEQGRKAAFWRNVGLAIRIAILIVIIVVAAIYVPKIVEAYKQVQEAVEEVQQMAEEVKQTATDISTTIDDLSETGSNVMKNMQDSVDKFSEAVKSLNPFRR